MTDKQYRGRIAPSPTGFLHIGHAVTFWHAQERARASGGKLVLRIEDLDLHRCRREFADAITADLHWFGLDWDEGPDIGGPFAPYIQSDRRSRYLEACEELRLGGFIYPCKCSRKDVADASLAPHDENEEPICPGTCRPRLARSLASTAAAHWRFRVPDGERIEFVDERMGRQSAVAGRDFGDFIVWRGDDVPAYQMAVVVDDAAMRISEVVRGEDLLVSTFRQLLLYRALDLLPPRFFHTSLVVDESGKRLAKRHGSLSLRELRGRGFAAEELQARYITNRRGTVNHWVIPSDCRGIPMRNL